VTGAVIVFHDVAAVGAMSLRMSYLTQHDFFTESPNRMLFNDRLTQAIALARRHGESLALLFLVLDDFKRINIPWVTRLAISFSSLSHNAWWLARAARTLSAAKVGMSSWCCSRKWLTRNT